MDEETLLYEAEGASRLGRLMWVLGFLIASVAIAFFYFWLCSSVLGIAMPKTAVLKWENARWKSRMEIIEDDLTQYGERLQALQERDEEIYRNIFGLGGISSELRNAGLGGVNRYAYLDGLPANSPIRGISVRLDVLSKKAYIQSKSFDEVESYSRRAGDMVSCIPAIPPLLTDNTKYHVSSPFGYRTDPFNGIRKMHTGFDFACNPGNPVYATGDGVVYRVSFELFGYGNSIVIDHGFGYKTRYAHLKDIYVTEGMKVKRGTNIGVTGKSGRASGPHLHYEVIYRDNYVNPYNYFDLSMPQEDYEAMVAAAEAEMGYMLTRPTKNIRHR